MTRLDVLDALANATVCNRLELDDEDCNVGCESCGRTGLLVAYSVKAEDGTYYNVCARCARNIGRD